MAAKELLEDLLGSYTSAKGADGMTVDTFLNQYSEHLNPGDKSDEKLSVYRSILSEYDSSLVAAAGAGGCFAGLAFGSFLGALLGLGLLGGIAGGVFGYKTGVDYWRSKDRLVSKYTDQLEKREGLRYGWLAV